MCYWGLLFGIWLNLTVSFIITLVRRFILHQNTELLLVFGSVYVLFDPSDNWFLYIFAYIYQIYTGEMFKHFLNLYIAGEKSPIYHILTTMLRVFCIEKIKNHNIIKWESNLNLIHSWSVSTQSLFRCSLNI